MQQIFAFTFLLLPFLCKGQEGFVIQQDLKLYYQTFGEGDPLLIINGGPGMSSKGFEELAKRLSTNNQTIIFDQRGTGRSVLSQIDASTITMDLMVQDIEALREHLKIDSWIVLGHSFGGMLASYYTSSHRERVRAMILSSSGGIDLDLTSYLRQKLNDNLTVTQRDSMNYWHQKIARGDTSFNTLFERTRVLASAYVYHEGYTALIAKRLLQVNGNINALVWRDLNIIRFDCSDELSSFDKPVLIIQGKQDIIEEKTGERAHKVFKKSKFVLLDECGHYGWLDQPEKFFNEVDNFLHSL